MPKSYFLNGTEVMFEGRKYKMPNNYDKFLTYRYGDYMKLPPIDKQMTTHSFEVEFSS